jgi:ribosomal protein S18 acetylase RimI-like enzyme
MKSGIEIRDLKKGEDLGRLVPLSREFFREYQTCHPFFFKVGRIRKTDITGYFSRFLEGKERRAFVAWEGEETIGYVTVCVQKQPGYWKLKRVGHISGLMVHRDRRRRGVGRKLLQKAMRFLGESGIGHYTLFTSVNNYRALRFYWKCGLEKLHITMLGKTTGGRRPV